VRWAETVRATFDDPRIDVVIQPIAYRKKRLLLADMDSTIIEQECVDELADALGLGREVAAITERTMRGEVPFEQSLIERVALLRGLDLGKAIQITSRITPTAGARTLVRTMRAHGATGVLASGGFTLFTAHVAQALGFDRHFANTLLVEGGRLTGGLKLPIYGRAAKRATLLALRDDLGLRAEETMAVGDGANDLAMLGEAGLGVAFRAKAAVAAVSRARIDHCDLTALLYLQGFSHTDFVT
jgi:phosphoserine phosphatase